MPHYQHSEHYTPATSDLRYDDNPAYETGFYIGSEGENGEHQRDITGWPYSIYRKTCAIGRSDMVLCHGIQNYDDAVEIANHLQCLA